MSSIIVGLIFIKNPFTALGQRYWTIKSLKYYTKNNRTNLDIHKILEQNEKWWDKSHEENNSRLLKKLRWVTLGYHHDWDTKVVTISSIKLSVYNFRQFS